MGVSPNQVALVITTNSADAEAGLKRLEQMGTRASEQLAAGFKGASAAMQAFEKQLDVMLEKHAGADPAVVRRQQEKLGEELSRLASAETAAYREAALRADQSSEKMRQANNAAQLLGGTLGVHLPRELNRFLAHSSLIGPALSAAFNLSIVAAFGAAIVAIFPKIAELIEQLRGVEKVNEEILDKERALNRLLAASGREKKAKDLTAEFSRTRARINEIHNSLAKMEGQAWSFDRLKFGLRAATDLGASMNQIKAWRQELDALQKRAGELKFAAPEAVAKEAEEAREKAREKAKEARQRAAEKRAQAERQDTEKTISLSNELTVAVAATDGAYREYLQTLGEISKLRNAYSRQALFELNEMRLRAQMMKATEEQGKKEAEWRFQATIAAQKFSLAINDEAAAEARLAQGVENLWAKSNRLREQWILNHTQLKPLTNTVVNQSIPAFQAAAASIQNFGIIGANALANFQQAMGTSIAQAIAYKQSIGAAMAAAAKATISSIAAEAMVLALKSLGLGFYYLATHRYHDAALAFQSAAIYGTIGGVAAVAARAIPGGETGGAGREASAGTTAGGGAAAAGTMTPVASEDRRPTVQIIVQGNIYGGQAGLDQLAYDISQAVTERDVNLTAYTVVRQPATRA